MVVEGGLELSTGGLMSQIELPWLGKEGQSLSPVPAFWLVVCTEGDSRPRIKAQL